MPRVLTKADVADFRQRLCEAAERLFAQKGLDAVTMRQLAAELGVSPMTPYRYFRDKEEILAAVRTSGFERFADKLQAARSPPLDPRAQGAAVRQAYLDFAFENPNTYRLMFDLNMPEEKLHPELARAAARARETMSGWVRELTASIGMQGDPEEIGAMFWAAAHGVVMLELAGLLPGGRASELLRTMNVAFARGLASLAAPAAS